MAELGQEKKVDFATLVKRAGEESFVALKELVEKSKSSNSSDYEKKINILKYLSKTQQRMLRLMVLAKWCQQVPLIQYCQQLGSTLSSHDTCFTQAADSMFFMHEVLQQARAPIYDVPSAIEVLLTGSYERLPKCIEDVGIQGTLTEDGQKPVLKKLDMLVRSKLLEVSLPKDISEVKVFDGAALLRVDSEFKVLATLGYRGHLSMWRILHLELLVGEKSGPLKLEESQRYVLGDDLERRMAATENPFMMLYSVLHELCVALVMDTVIRQVQALRQGRWKDAIRFELTSDGSAGQGGVVASMQLSQDIETDSSILRTPGLKILYWLDFDKNSGTTDHGFCPYLKIEPGPDLQIKCTHSSFVVDPVTGKGAEFLLDQSCIDVEMLLLRAIRCNRYTRLLEIFKELCKNAQICRTSDDVLLNHHYEEPNAGVEQDQSNAMEYKGQDILSVRAYGSSYFTLGINIRNGRFLLHSSTNILAVSELLESEEALNQGSMTAAEVFIALRSKSLLHLFACIGRFLGLEVYEHGFAAVKMPKNIMSGPNSLLMGFPECGSSYFLLMQLDGDFKPLFKLLETQLGLSGKAQHLSDSNSVVRVKNVDIGQMQILEDELNLSLLDCRKLSSLLPTTACANQASDHSLFLEYGFEGSEPSCCFSSGFSSIVDEVFELEKGQSGSAKSLSSSLDNQPQLGPSAMGSHTTKPCTSSPMSEGVVQTSQINNTSKVSLYPLTNLKGLMQSNSTSSISSGPGRSTGLKKLSGSKSDQDLSSMKSPCWSPRSAEVCSDSMMDEDQPVVAGSHSARLLSPPRPTVPRTSTTVKSNGPRSIPAGALAVQLKVPGSNLLDTTPTSQVIEPVVAHDKLSRKRRVSDMLNLLPSLLSLEVNEGFRKRRKLGHIDQAASHRLISSQSIGKSEKYNYENLVAEASKGNAPTSIYVSALLHVVRHCSLCIKHARLTSQMDALDIPYVEEVGLRNGSFNLWFRLPFARGNTWQHICLRLGRPGTMYWDVKINDQHFRDLWELQKGSNNTPCGSGVRIANTSDTDSHIRHDPEGVVLSYHSVEADSIKKLVADIQRLSNARMFALGMRKLLGVRSEEKWEEGNVHSDGKGMFGIKSLAEVSDKLSEQMRRAFRIEAVGLMSLWFSFYSGFLARFVVEWESGKEGCTMHVSPEQLWPHTKFLEDFINGAEVASLLDCIRLTAGPLNALAGATRPARAAPVSGVPVVTSAVSSIAKQNAYVLSQGHVPNSSTSINNQASSASVGNPGISTSSGALGTHPHPGAAMLAAATAVAGRGGPGIVPSSLLPIDVSVVLRGPYWIRIIYRKNFAVDMRCFAGDQVWLQPSTPPKGGPSFGGSLPCPQFRPFIMEHVAQELHGLEPSFTGAQPVGLANSNNSNPTGAQLSAPNGNKANLSNSGAISRAGNQVISINRVGNALQGISSLPTVCSGMPSRRPAGAGVPAHMRGELNTAIIGLGDDGGYGGGWVPLVALKKVLRGILKYLGVLWLFAQLPDLLKDILGSILKDNEGALLNLDLEQPALRFFVGGYVFSVSVHRVQLLLQVISVKRYHHSQQQQQPNSATVQEELTQSETNEICDYFSRRVASEPYDASRVASFITLLTLPISVLREFLKLIAWKKALAQSQGGDVGPAQKSRIELCLENHAGLNMDGNSENFSASKSNIHYDRPHNSVDFALTVVLDPAHIPHINAAGGAAWLPYCVSVKLRYIFGEKPNVSFLGMDGSHGGRACWQRVDDWEKCKQRVRSTVELNGASLADASQGRLRIVADSIQRTLHL